VVTGLSLEDREVLITTTHDAVPDFRYHMASESIWPLATAVVVGGTLIGLIFHPAAFAVGAIFLFVTLLGWFWPTTEPKPIFHAASHEESPPAQPEAVTPGGTP
jgi:hypothetical protein